MLLLHAVYGDRGFDVWAERSPGLTGDEPPPSSRRTTRHPFAAEFAELATVLGAATGDPATCVRPEVVALWLPTAGRMPCRSSPLDAALPGRLALRPWQVPVCGLAAEVVVDLLAGLADRPTVAPGVGVGATLRYWAAAVRFAAALVTREQFLPDVVNRSGAWVAQWTPIVAGADAARFDRLARAMPAACRAGGDAAPVRPAAAVLRDFVVFAVDELVRGATAAPPARTRFDSIHDQWLHALRSESGAMAGSDDELSRLAEQVRAWQVPIAVAADAPFRLGFRLDEPADGAAAWHVRYFLQSRDDPSLHVPAADVWAGSVSAAAGRMPLTPLLLTGLGQAANLSPAVADSLRGAKPTGFATTADGAHRFLTETAWSLEQAGFGVLLPAWWTGHATKQRLALAAHVKSPPMSGGGGLTLDDLVQFEWKVAVGDTELTLAELKALAKLKAPLVRVRGQWVQVNADDIRAAIDLLKAKAAPATVRDAMRLALGVAPAGVALPTRGVTASGWVEQFLKQLTTTAGFTELPPPAGLKATLRPYQLRGYSWLAFLRRWGLGACLADDMGLGKTVQTLALLQRDREAGEKRPALLVCPMSVVGNWAREAAKFTPDLPVVIHHGGKRAKTAAALKKAAAKAGVVVTSYGLLVRDRHLFEPLKWAGVVLDEAQMVKNPHTKMSQAARATASDYRIALTGTPVENHVGDLWALGQFLNPGLLGNQTEFRRDFFVPIQRHQDATAAELLKKRTGPFLLRRVKSDPTVIADLPAKIETTEFCTLTKEQASLYAAVTAELSDALDDAEGIRRKGLVLGALSKLKQVCNHPAHFLGDRSAIPNRSGKLARLTELLDELLDAGDKALVFTQFTEMGDILQRHLQDTFGREILFLHGGTPRKRRDEMVARFQSADGPPVFLLSLKAGGTGLNLTAATHVFHYDRWWNPAVETQATDRAYRIGQTRTVHVHAFVCAGTLEEKIAEMLARKRDVAAKVVGTGEAWLTELNDAQLRELLTLGADAVEE